jgi:glycosyltransferase involved in cell wall biosynthesis
MRALLIHQAFVSPGESGGTRHYEFARHLASRGHSFTVVAGDLNYQTGRRTVGRGGGVFVEQEVDGVRVLRAYTCARLHRSFFWRLVTFLSFMLTSVWAGLRAGPVDVVMGTSPPIFQAVSAWAVALARRRPFLLEVRDLWPDFAIEVGVLKNPVLIRLSRWLERFLYARAAHLIVNSPAYRDHLLGKGVPEAQITLIPNGVDTTMFDPGAKGERVRKELGLDGQFVVTYAGALGLANDIPVILRAAERLRDDRSIHFLLVGDGKERPNLEMMARQRSLSNVTFMGTRPKAEMGDVLAASDACVACLKDVPMFRTTYPNKVFDYMAAGRPTILAIDGVIRRVVEDGRGGVFVPPGDDAALAEAVRELSRDLPRAHALGASARGYVVEHFDRRRQAAQFSACLTILVRHSRAGRG